MITMKAYKISRNSHYCNFSGINFHFGKLDFSRKVIFHESCYYDFLNGNSYDVNKLCGLSHGIHLEDSVRFGWLPNFKKKKKIEVYGYLHNIGIITFAKICDVDVNTEIDIKWKYLNEKIIFSVYNGKESFNVDMMYNKPNFLLGYYLNPYFGGDNTAPRDMKIFIE